jgi:DNA-binding transcriptional LysR family regulator
MIIRRLGQIPKTTCASPAYLKHYSVPASLADLEDHRMVGFVSARTGRMRPLEFQTEGGTEEKTLDTTVTVNDAETLHHLARLGYGLVQAPRYRYRDDLAKGALVEVLPAHPPSPLPLAAYYPQNRQLSPRVRAFLDWVVEVFEGAEF